MIIIIIIFIYHFFFYLFIYLFIHLFIDLLFQGFFRRTVRQKLVYKPCENPKGCLIMRISRNRCQYCRMQRCIMAGMSHEGKYAYSRPSGLDFNVNRFSYIPRVSNYSCFLQVIKQKRRTTQ